MKSRIIYEDKQIIVCHKPAGVPVQSSRVSTPDMVSILKNHLAQERTSGSRKPSPAGQAPYLAVIHRLDQPVEGLLVFAKTPAAARELNRQLTSSGFGKYYLAVVRGIPSPSEADLMDYLVKDGRSNTSRVCTAETPGARPARLHYRLAETYGEGSGTSSLLEIQLDTGRHQSTDGQSRMPAGRRQKVRRKRKLRSAYALRLQACIPPSGRPERDELRAHPV